MAAGSGEVFPDHNRDGGDRQECGSVSVLEEDMKLIAEIIKSHRFFVRESRAYAGGWNWKFPTQYPRAYVRFMWFSVRDHFRYGRNYGN